MPVLGQLSTFFQGWAGLNTADVGRSLRQLRKAGLLPARRAAIETAVSVDHAIWLLLALLAGSVEKAREIARMPNSRQALNGTIINEGDPAMTVFDGIRDAINLRRSGSIALAADFRLAELGGFFSATIGCQSILQQSLPDLPAGSRASWNFTFGRPVELAGPDPCFWRLSVVNAEAIDSLASLFGPLTVTQDEPLDMYPVPTTIPARYQAVTVH
jgi:hypothetical protein